MRLSELKNTLPEMHNLEFYLEDGTMVPAHFHITELGTITKKFIDCGGTVREENAINFQLWSANDYDHRLTADKLLSIINIAEKAVDLEDHNIEIEYQAGTIGKFGLSLHDGKFVLTSKHTDCLAKDNCGIPSVKEKLQLADIAKCAPGSGCC